jgi:hypothetical protein
MVQGQGAGSWVDIASRFQYKPNDKATFNDVEILYIALANIRILLKHKSLNHG